MGVLSESYTTVLIAQIGIAVAQPFLLNAITKVAARWFPIQERRPRGMGTLAMYQGRLLRWRSPRSWSSEPASPPCCSSTVRCGFRRGNFPDLRQGASPHTRLGGWRRRAALVFDGIKLALRQQDFLLTMVIFFIGLGVFNGVITWIEDIVRPAAFRSPKPGWPAR